MQTTLCYQFLYMLLHSFALLCMLSDGRLACISKLQYEVDD